MKPGRELDALVAEKVMGWKKDRVRVGRNSGDGTTFWTIDALRFGDRIHALEPHDQPLNVPGLPPYSTDIAAAWEVVDNMRARNLEFEISSAPHRLPWLAKFGRRAEPAPTPAHAICLAALKAVGAEV